MNWIKTHILESISIALASGFIIWGLVITPVILWEVGAPNPLFHKRVITHEGTFYTRSYKVEEGDIILKGYWYLAMEDRDVKWSYCGDDLYISSKTGRISRYIKPFWGKE